MASINDQSTRNRSPGNSRRKSKSTRIDMTAMVDVAFLLLTFFVLTATLQQNSVMELVVPPKCEGPDCTVDVKENKILTLILDKDHLSYYLGNNVEQLETSDYASSNVRSILTTHLNRYPDRCDREISSDCWDPIFVVKPMQNCKYKQLVDLLDELAIVDAKKFALDSFSEADSLLLAQANS